MGRKIVDDIENEEEFISVDAELVDEDELYIAETSGEWQEDEYIAIEEGLEDYESTHLPYDDDYEI